jgi:hypothetical protein
MQCFVTRSGIDGTNGQAAGSASAGKSCVQRSRVRAARPARVAGPRNPKCILFRIVRCRLVPTGKQPASNENVGSERAIPESTPHLTGYEPSGPINRKRVEAHF